MQRDLEHEQVKREAERKGRIRAEQQLKALIQSTGSSSDDIVSSTAEGVLHKVNVPWPMRPIGTISSVFIRR